jgi:hypothetical protein
MMLLFCLLAALTPEFTAEGVIPLGSLTPRMLKPGIIATIYGKHLGPVACAEARVQPPHPKAACGVKVLVGKTPAELLYVHNDQIKHPDHLVREFVRYSLAYFDVRAWD